MAKDKGILLNTETGDLLVSTERDELGFIVQGIVIKNSMYQNQAIILQITRGELKEYPMLGCDINSLIHDNEITGWKREITLQLESDGVIVKDVNIDMNKNKLIIDASYSS